MGTPLKFQALLALVLLALCVDADAQSFDGNWNGTTSQGKNLFFSVANNAITSIILAFTFESGCPAEIFFDTTLATPSPITDNSFSVTDRREGRATVSYTISGTFGSSTSASGNLLFMGSGCLGNAAATWSAVKAGAGFPLTVQTQSGATSATGTITSSPAGINCGADCAEIYASAVTLAATPSDGSFFAGWRGGCTGTGACVLPMTAPTFVAAVFGVMPEDLVTAGVNRAEYRTGDEISASLALNNPDNLSPLPVFFPPVAAEVYIGLLLPDGDTIVFFAPSGTVFGRAADLGSFVSLATGVSLASSFSVTAPNFFTYQWSGTEPPGTYKFFIVVMHAGALADRVVNPGDILTVKIVSFTFQP